MGTAVERLTDENAIRQLVDAADRMRELGSEGGIPKLDWVLGVSRLLEADSWLDEVEAEASALANRGIRHIIWTGMGGSVMTVRVLLDLGMCGAPTDGVTVRPLDSTDPAALNTVVRAIAKAKGLTLTDDASFASTSVLRRLLGDVLMIGVSMGMTSEEPITHLEWFADLLARADLPVDRHCLIMTLPGSYLDRFAHERGCPVRPLQLDGGSDTGGRMSAPTTRVFLLPAALALLNVNAGAGALRAVLQAAWSAHDLGGAVRRPMDHPYVRLAAILSDAAVEGACRLVIAASSASRALVPWIEQLLEESLGKDGKGIIVFDDAPLNRTARCFRERGTVRVRIGPAQGPDDGITTIPLPALDPGVEGGLSSVAEAFLGWQLCMALYGYLQDIQFAGQPAVEDYKARARAMRAGDPLLAARTSGTVVEDGPLTLFAPPGADGRLPLAEIIAASLRGACPPYVDLTINGEAFQDVLEPLRASLNYLGHSVLGSPVKLRRAPAAYHSTEQSEMDGPPGVVSVRILARKQEGAVLGQYESTFLVAQAVGTWQAMIDAGRVCYLLLVGSTLADGAPHVQRMISDVAALLQPASGDI